MRIPAERRDTGSVRRHRQAPVFDRDSRQVAWIEHDPVRRQNVISVRSLKDSQLRQIPVAGPTNAVQFSPDGKSVVAVTVTNGQSMVWMYPIDGAKPVPILTLGPERGTATRLSPDGRKMTFLVPKNTPPS
jgi:hypothetical protein